MSNLISIIIPTYNRAHLIVDTVDSICAQAYTNWECIIIDDGSTDQTKKIIGEYVQKDSRIKYLTNTRTKGAQGARNTGLLNSNGKYIIFFDSDNKMKPTMLEELMAVMDKKDVDVVCCYADVLDEKKTKINEFKWNSNGRIDTKIVSGETYVDYNIGLIKKSTFDLIDLTDEDCPSYQEWDTHIRLSQHATYYTLEKNLVDYYRRSEGAISNSNRRSIEGYFYVLNKHIKIFSAKKSVALDQGYKFVSTLKNTHDKDLIDEFSPKILDLIPGLSKYLRKRNLENKINAVKHRVKSTLKR